MAQGSCYTSTKEDTTHWDLSSQTHICHSNTLSSHWTTHCPQKFVTSHTFTPTYWSVCIQAHWIHRCRLDCHSSPHYSPTWIILNPHMSDIFSLTIQKPSTQFSYPVLFQKLLQLPIPSDILVWIFNFLSGRTQAVSSFGHTSGWLPVTHSIIQGSGIGPCLSIRDICLRPPSSLSIQCHWWCNRTGKTIFF